MQTRGCITAQISAFAMKRDTLQDDEVALQSLKELTVVVEIAPSDRIRRHSATPGMRI